MGETVHAVQLLPGFFTNQRFRDERKAGDNSWLEFFRRHVGDSKANQKKVLWFDGTKLELFANWTRFYIGCKLALHIIDTILLVVVAALCCWDASLFCTYPAGLAADTVCKRTLTTSKNMTLSIQPRLHTNGSQTIMLMF